MKAYRRLEVQFHAFFNSELDLCERSATYPGRTTPGESTSTHPYDEGHLDARISLNMQNLTVAMR